MCDRSECIAILHENLSRMQDEFGITGMTVFGSVARGDNRADSDVDILVEMPPRIFQLSALKAFLEAKLRTSVDLVRDHSRLSQKFRNQISRDAITIL